MQQAKTRLFVVMGVAGCGKSTIGAALARALGGRFLDGDAYHPPQNIEKMSRGEALTDGDRWPWLSRFAYEMAAHSGLVVGGCSALKRSYRALITRKAGEAVTFVHLAGSRDLIAGRMAVRDGHFMPLSLLDSQFAALEVPGLAEDAVSVDISGSTAETVAAIETALKERMS